MTTITSTEAGATGRYINLGSSVSQDSHSAQTVIAYAKLTSAAVTGYLFGKVSSTATFGPRFVITATKAISFGADSTGLSLAPERFTVADTAPISTWTHYQATWDGALNGSNINVYLDAGANVATLQNVGSGALNDDAAQELYLLNRPGLGREFVGDIAYVARWNRVLSDAERTTVRTTGPLDVPSGLTLCWANQQDYSVNALTPVARSTFVAGSTPTNTSLGGATATTLSGPASGATGVASANFTVGANGMITGTVTVTPNDAANGGTFTPTSVAISAASPTATFTYTPVSTGVKTISISDDGGLTDATPLSYTSNAGSVKGVALTLSNGATLQASLTGIRALWWDAIDPSGVPTYSTATASTSAAGVLTLDLNATTSLAIGAYGFLLLYKVNATRNDSLVFAGQVAVSDVA